MPGHGKTSKSNVNCKQVCSKLTSSPVQRDTCIRNCEVAKNNSSRNQTQPKFKGYGK